MEHIESQDLQVIVTTEPGIETIGLNEIQRLQVPHRFLKWIDAGVALIEVSEGFLKLAARFQKDPPVFIRHICPVHWVIGPLKQEEHFSQLQDLCNEMIDLLNPSETFSIQTRVYGKDGINLKPYDINQFLSEELVNRGLSLDIKNPEQVVSIVISGETLYLGISKAMDNLSNWGGGAHRFLKEAENISRAEFKLLEAIDLFKLKPPTKGRGLDLGAAPGGWTRVLRNMGLTVTAVDPAELHPSLKADSGVIHIKDTAQNFFKKADTFDIIVNDMRMDAKDSARIMGMAVDFLEPHGIGIMTLKLPSKGMQKITYQVLDLLKNWYEIIGARQLFHNRSEVTVVLKKRSN